jgi:hypothetical protein
MLRWAANSRARKTEQKFGKFTGSAQSGGDKSRGYGGDKECKMIGSKIGKHLQLCGRARYRATRKNLESRTQLDEPVEWASGGDPLLLYKILHLLFFPLVRILCALSLESRKKYQHCLHAGLMKSLFLQNSVALLRGHWQNTRSHLP